MYAWRKFGTLGAAPQPAAKNLSPPPNPCRQATLCFSLCVGVSFHLGDILKSGGGDNFVFVREIMFWQVKTTPFQSDSAERQAGAQVPAHLKITSERQAPAEHNDNDNDTNNDNDVNTNINNNHDTTTTTTTTNNNNNIDNDNDDNDNDTTNNNIIINNNINMFYYYCYY